MKDANLDVCIARDPTACAIKYDINSMSVGITKGGAIGYGLVCDDYLKFNGEKILTLRYGMNTVFPIFTALKLMTFALWMLVSRNISNGTQNF